MKGNLYLTNILGGNMLDIKLIREDVEGVIKKLNTRGKDFSYLRELVEKDDERRNKQNA